jgi:hypothetical protein
MQRVIMKSKFGYHIVYFFLICSSVISGQAQHITSIYPSANFIGAERNTDITLHFDSELDTTSFHNGIFNVFGSNSGAVKGKSFYDIANNKITFSLNKQFYAGEVVTVGFGPVKTSIGDTISAYHWQFTVKITKPTPPYFKPPVTYQQQTFSPLFCIDMDNDGSLDIISTNGWIIFNNGDGTFSRKSYKPELVDLNFISDLNNDGNPDLICGNGNYFPDTKIFLGDGNGNFTLAQNFNPGFFVLAVGDINGDNYNDFLAITGSIDYSVIKLQFYINDKTGHFYLDTNEYIINGNGLKAILTDLNNDGKTDLAIINQGLLNPPESFRGFQLFINDGKGHFTNTQNIYIGDVGFKDIFSNDFNNDGYIDIATSGQLEGTSIIKGDKDGIFSTMNTLMFGGAEDHGQFLTGDMNGDNRIDLLDDSWVGIPEAGDSAFTGFDILLNSSVNPFLSINTIRYFPLGYLLNHTSGDPVLGDVNNDGALDLIHGNPSGYTTVFINTDSVSGIKDKFFNKDFTLKQNYPNPFNGQTIIKYSIHSPGTVKITLYDVMGRELKVLVNEYKNPGEHEIRLNGNTLSSGVYIYQLESNSIRLTKKMLYLK